MDRAAVLRMAGDHAGARAAARQALDDYDRKGNLVSAGRAGFLLGRLPR
jgi:hypothetical protein